MLEAQITVRTPITAGLVKINDMSSDDVHMMSSKNHLGNPYNELISGYLNIAVSPSICINEGFCDYSDLLRVDKTSILLYIN